MLMQLKSQHLIIKEHEFVDTNDYLFIFVSLYLKTKNYVILEIWNAYIITDIFVME